jgi:undecaprenyl-diphosphatase
VAQIVAGIFPGTSRSSATIFSAMLAGTTNRSAATEFAFLVGIPTMYAASAYELYRHWDPGGNEDWSALSAAFLTSLITAFVSVKWLLSYIRSHRFTSFALYRISLGALLLAMTALGILS